MFIEHLLYASSDLGAGHVVEKETGGCLHRACAMMELESDGNQGGAQT